MSDNANSYARLIYNMVNNKELKFFNFSLFSILTAIKLNIFNINQYILINTNNIQIVSGIIDVAFIIEGAICLCLLLLFIYNTLNKFIYLFIPKDEKLERKSNQELIKINKKIKARNVIYVITIISLIIYIIFK